MPHPLGAGVQIKLLAYLLSSTLIIWGADHYRRVRKRLEDEEKFRKLAVEELAHRLKNKLATIQSIISFQLRDEPQVRDTILRRLSALSATDDLIMAAQGQGAHILNVLSTELRPYGASRISIEGPDCLLSPKLALTHDSNWTLFLDLFATRDSKHKLGGFRRFSRPDNGDPIVNQYTCVCTHHGFRSNAPRACKSLTFNDDYGFHE